MTLMCIRIEFQYSKNISSIHIYNSGKEIISYKISHNTCKNCFLIHFSK